MPAEGQPLSSLPAGSTGTVTAVKVQDKGRLLEMGVLPGTRIEIIRYAPLGDPVEIRVRGYNLSLRKHEAEQVWIQPV